MGQPPRALVAWGRQRGAKSIKMGSGRQKSSPHHCLPRAPNFLATPLVEQLHGPSQSHGVAPQYLFIDFRTSWPENIDINTKITFLAKTIENFVSRMFLSKDTKNNENSLHYITLSSFSNATYTYSDPVVHQQIHVIRNTAHRPSTQASYTSSRVRPKRKISCAAQIAATLTISFPRWRHMSLASYWGQQRMSLTFLPRTQH